MASSGLRPPQFSEDIAWLPAWLQSHEEILLDKHIKDVQTTSQEAYKDLVFLQGNTRKRKDVNLLTREGARYDNFHLFLSGGENSPVFMTPSSGNFMNLHLHLSSDGSTQQNPISICNIPQTERHDSNKIMSMQSLPETSAQLEDRSCQYKMEVKDSMVNAPLPSKPVVSPNFSNQSLAKDKKGGRDAHQEKLDCKQLKKADIKDAVELSIAASEALAIIELVKNGSASEFFPASSVLEVALRVKQARNHLCQDGLDDVSDCKTDEVDEIDLLLDLNEDAMADAFDDVGLPIMQVDTTPHDLWCSSSVIKQGCSFAGTFSRVLDTPVSENCHECDGEVHKSDSIHSVQANSEVIGTIQAVNLGINDITSFHTQDSIASSPQVQESRKDAGAENEVIHIVPDRFRSRWLGGWTGKDAEVFARVDLNDTKSMPKFVIGETSFLSESPDIVLDEISFVHKLEEGSKIASLSSLAYEGLHNIADKGITFSQDIVGSSILSLVDPLCSVVPCSIDSETADATLSTNQKNIEEAAKCSNPELEQNIVTKMNSEGSGATVHRKLNSLKAYSMLLPQNAGSECGIMYCDGSVPIKGILGLLPSEKVIDCFNSSGDRDPTRLMFSKHTSKCSAAKDYEKDHKFSTVGKPIIESTDQNKDNDEIANDEAELQIHQQEERHSPLFLNNGIRRRLQASKMVLGNDNGDVNLKRSSVPEMTIPKGVVICEDQSKIVSYSRLHSNQHPNPYEDRGSSEKRVRFSVAEVSNFQPSRSGQKLGSGYRARSISRTNKRLKASSGRSDLTLETITNWTNSLIMDKKRMIFQGLEFLLTGFVSQKEMELELLIREHGGFVLSDVPPPPNLRGKRRSRCKLQQLPVVLSPKKLQTSKFLYGCAVNGFLLKVNWLTDSIAAGLVLPPEKYMILSNQHGMKHSRIGRPVRCHNLMFDRVGIMLHGKHSFCTKLAKIIKHGGGQVFRTIQWLVQSLKYGKISVGAIVAEDGGRASRHLRHFASEQKLPTMPVSWIINSLHSRKLLPFKDSHRSFTSPSIKIPEFPITMELSEEI